MRRLPIYFLLDVSESMIGEPMDQMQKGLGLVISELRKDPYALETVYLSIFAFAGKVAKVCSMVELYNYYPPKLAIGGGTSLGKALDALMNDISLTVRKTTYEEKGDWKPIVFLFTDGKPTDQYQKTFQRWASDYKTKANLIVVSIGDNIDLSIFASLTENILILKHTDAESFKTFFKWITASIQTNSMSVAEHGVDKLALAPINENVLSHFELSKNDKKYIDDNFAVILAKCQKNKRPYLIKYEKNIGDSLFKEEFGIKALNYNLVGAFQVDDTYFDLLDDSSFSSKINTASLRGFPSCPCCGNQYGFSFCSCGNVMCTGAEKESTCPWCGVKARFEITEGSADINRTRG